MKNILLVLLLILPLVGWSSEHKSLSCSKNKTMIFFINGMNYEPDQYRDALKFDQKDVYIDGQYI